MTVGELIEILECFDSDMEVRIAEQQRYPMEYEIDGVAEYETNEGNCAYICEGYQLGYASRKIWDCIE